MDSDSAAASRARAAARMNRKRIRIRNLCARASDSESSEYSSESNEDLPVKRKQIDESGAADASSEESSVLADDLDEIQEDDHNKELDGGIAANFILTEDDHEEELDGAVDNLMSEQSNDEERGSEESVLSFSGDENQAGSDLEPPQSDGSQSDDIDFEAEAESEVESVQESENSNAESSDDEPENVDAEQPIYPGAPITLLESLVAIFTLMSSEHLSGKLIGNILSLIALHCPPGSLIKKTLYTFKKFFANINSSLIVFHYFCSDCMYPVETKESSCTKCMKKGDNISFFLELPLVNQLQHLFCRENFYQDLQFRFNASRKLKEDSIEDIYDGRIYKEQMDSGFLSNPSNLSFMWYSDGVKVFNSASFSIWPLCLVINELPYKKRTLPENILLCGLWFGKHKPSPNIFLRPLRSTMKKLETDGHNFTLPDTSKLCVKCKILCGTCDMPAKCKFLQFKQYNGEYGCPQCLLPGGRMAAGKSTVQVYPYSAVIPKRTHHQTMQHAREALEARKTNNKASVCGVKGPSLLSKLVPDLIRCTAIDAMHGVFLGVCKLLFDLWFNSTHSAQPWSLRHLLNVVEEKLQNVKPPSYAVRAPRSLGDLKFWKASEYKLFFIYYSIPVLKGVMDEAYLYHHCKLVSAVTLLSQDSISIDQIDAASLLLKSYVSDFERLYSLRFLGINVHQLLHLPDVVLDLGPLFVYSTFFLESYNGVINKFFHGTQHIAFQICSAAAMLLQVPKMRKALPPGSEVVKFCDALESGKPFKLADVVDAGTFAVGKYNRNPQQVLHSKEVLLNSMIIVGGQCDIFYRL